MAHMQKLLIFCGSHANSAPFSWLTWKSDHFCDQNSLYIDNQYQKFSHPHQVTSTPLTCLSPTGLSPSSGPSRCWKGLKRRVWSKLLQVNFLFSTNKIMRLQVTHTWCSGCLSSERVLQKWPPMDTFLSLLFILRYTSLHFVYTCVNICVYTCILLNPFVYTFVYTSLHFCVCLCKHLWVHRCVSVYQVKELST